MLQQTSASTGSKFEASPALAGWLNLRVALFVVVVLVPVIALGYVYFKATFGSGIREAEDGYVWVDLQKMSSFSFDQRNGTVEQVPEQWRALDGKRVILEGEMWAGRSSAPELAEFDLVWSVANCCFTGAPQVQHFVHSKTADGRKVPYYARPVRVKGTLKVDVTRSEGQVTGVYHLDVDSVEPLS